MSDPDDHEWLLMRERGEDVSHIPAATRAAYDELIRLLAELPEREPGPDWKQRTLAAIEQRSQRARGGASNDDRDAIGRPGPRRRRWVIAGGLATAAAAAAVFLTLCHGDAGDDRPGMAVRAPQTPTRNNAAVFAPAIVATADIRPAPANGPPTVVAEIRRGDRPHRSGSDSASIGDTLVLRAEAGGPIELRVYGDTGEPLARCTEHEGCIVERVGGRLRLRLELALRAAGDVRAVLFTGEPVPDAFVELDADVEAAQRAGVEARQMAVFHVQ